MWMRDYMKDWAVRFDFLYFTDLHLHEWPLYGITTDKGHSRLMDGVSILYQVSKYMQDNGIRFGIFGGDINHLHDKMLFSVQYQLAKWFEHEDRLRHAWVFMLGNHDRDTVTGETHCLEPFKALPRVTVVEEPKRISQQNFAFRLIPWMVDGDVDTYVQDDANVTILHHDFSNVEYRGRRIGRSGSTRSFERTFSLCGHYHDRIVISNQFMYAGAPMQHDWGDRGKKRGFYHITLRRDKKTLQDLPPKVRFIRAKYPKFVLIEHPEEFSEEQLQKKVTGNFVRVLNTSDKTNHYVKKIMVMGARAVEPIDPEVDTFDAPAVAEEVESVFDFEEVVSGFIKKADTNLNKKRLEKIALKALRKVA